jgi:FkbM family methyltransferase
MAEKMHVGQAGTLLYDENERPYVVAKQGRPGFVLFGPYDRYIEKGTYKVTFEITIDENFKEDGIDFCRVDVIHWAGRGIVINRTSVNSNAETRNGVISVVLPFVVDTPGVLEYRVESLGRQSFGVKYERKISIPGQSDSDRGYGRFYFSNEEKIRKLLLLGARIISSSGDGIVIEWRGIRLQVDNREDFVLIHEILKDNSYNFVLPGEVCAVDIGMNVGIASLHMATNAAVRVIHGFEPFSRPFARAIRNFSLNPALSAKIRPYHIGIGGANEVLEVPVLENETIGTSIRGRTDGTIVDRISIKEAAEVLRPIIVEASGKRQTIVFKLDCEGSEFAILQSLHDHHLIRNVDAFMIECHKNWTADKDNETINKVFSDNGFYIFDFNHMDTPGSNIYACRAPISN